MRLLFFLLLFMMVCSGCGQSSLPIAPNTPIPTTIPAVITVLVTEAVRSAESATPTPSPTVSPTPSHTPTPTPLPTATAIPDEIDAMADPLLASTCATLPASECRALRRIFLATQGDQWGGEYPDESVRWYNSANPCDWYGIECDSGRVIRLTLNEIGMNGSLPSEIGHLTALQEISIYKNRLRGRLPDSIGALQGLVSADFSNNEFSGEIPLFFSEMPQLEALNLNYNAFSGTLPPALASAPKLGWLDVSFNYLNGSVPTDYAVFDYFNGEGNDLRE